MEEFRLTTWDVQFPVNNGKLPTAIGADFFFDVASSKEKCHRIAQETWFRVQNILPSDMQIST